MKSLNKHIVEYYQEKKFLGYLTFEGELDDSLICYANRKYINNGKVQLKKKYTATEGNPIMTICYNLQGRIIK